MHTPSQPAKHASRRPNCHPLAFQQQQANSQHSHNQPLGQHATSQQQHQQQHHHNQRQPHNALHFALNLSPLNHQQNHQANQLHLAHLQAYQSQQSGSSAASTSSAASVSSAASSCSQPLMSPNQQLAHPTSATSTSSTSTTSSSAGAQNSSRYKTELCRPYEENGTCKYGEKCQFAHGLAELRTLTRHPKYKTEFCRTFHTTGFCPYGPRCHFIHNSKTPSNQPIAALVSQPYSGESASQAFALAPQPPTNQGRQSVSPPSSPISSIGSSQSNHIQLAQHHYHHHHQHHHHLASSSAASTASSTYSAGYISASSSTKGAFERNTTNTTNRLSSSSSSSMSSSPSSPSSSVSPSSSTLSTPSSSSELALAATNFHLSEPAYETSLVNQLAKELHGPCQQPSIFGPPSLIGAPLPTTTTVAGASTEPIGSTLQAELQQQSPLRNESEEFPHSAGCASETQRLFWLHSHISEGSRHWKPAICVSGLISPRRTWQMQA